MMIKKLFVTAALLYLLGACSSTPTSYDLAKDQIKAEQLREDSEKKRLRLEQEKAEEQIKSLPEWAINPPKADSSGFYAVGIADSKSVSIAIKKAELDAQYNLAKTYQQILSGNEKSYVSESGVGSQTDSYTKVVDSLISKVSVAGFETVNKTIIPMQGRIHAYILMKLPYDEVNKIVSRQKNDAPNPEIKAAFEELERRVNQSQEL